MTQAFNAPPDHSRPGGLLARLGDALANMSPLEQLAWAVALIVLLAVALVYGPALVPGSEFAGLTATPIQNAASSLSTRTPTLAPTPTLTATPTGTPLPTLEPLNIPTPPANGMFLTFSPAPNRTGSLDSRGLGPSWNNRNLYSGVYGSQTYIGIATFDLTSLAPNTQIAFAAIELTGRNAQVLAAGGEWFVDVLDAQASIDWDNATWDLVQTSPAAATLGKFTTRQLAPGVTNRLVLSPAQRTVVEQQLNIGTLILRLRGPAGKIDNLFAWDAGPGAAAPVLSLVVIPASFAVITTTPTPANLYAAATRVAEQTLQATRFGTPTPLPRLFVTATPGAQGDVVVNSAPPPQNRLTATAISVYATAVAATTGTFTPTPLNWVTTTPTPILVTLAQLTPLPTPLAPNESEVSRPQLYQTPIPPEANLRGRILFTSDRQENRQTGIWVMDTNGSVLAKLTGDLYYRVAVNQQLFAPDGKSYLDVGKDPNGLWQIVLVDIRQGTLTPLIQEEANGKGIGAYHPAFSPQGDQVAFVSERTGYAEIYVYDIKTKLTKRLTTTPIDLGRGYPPYNKFPTWSPEGKKIIFFSNRDGNPPRDQIFIMDADGGGLHNFSPSPYNDGSAVWVR